MPDCMTVWDLETGQSSVVCLNCAQGYKDPKYRRERHRNNIPTGLWPRDIIDADCEDCGVRVWFVLWD